jgi:DNA-binding NarL/FixJ family response regulator
VLTVVIVSDEAFVEAGLRSILGQTQDFELTCVSQNTPHAMDLIGKCNPDLIVCVNRPDLDLPLAELRYASPRSAVVVLSRDFSPEFAHQALAMGVRGLISTTAAPSLLAECLRGVAQGNLWMENSLSMRLLDMRPVNLSRRQTQLIRLLAQGLKNKEIGAALGIAEGTVKAYLTVLFEKVGAKDRFELALFGLKHLRGRNEEHPVPPVSVPRSALTRRLRRSEGREGWIRERQPT